MNRAVPSVVAWALKLNCWDFPPLIVALDGDGPVSIVGLADPEGVRLGMTLKASAVPVFVKVTVIFIVCPTLTEDGLAVTPKLSAAASST